MISISLRKWIWSLVMIFAFTTLAPVHAGDGEVVTSHSPLPSPTSSLSPKPAVKSIKSNQSMGCIADPEAIEDIKKAREANEAKQKDLNSKEAELKDREKAFNEELKKLAQAREDLLLVSDAKKKEKDAKVEKIVETLLTMSPKAAAKVLTSLDDQLAVAAISKMEPQRLAKIMNLMDASRSSKLSEILAGVVRAKNGSVKTDTVAVSHDTDATINSSVKGGDNKNGHNEQQANGSGAKQAPGQQNIPSIETESKPH